MSFNDLGTCEVKPKVVGKLRINALSQWFFAGRQQISSHASHAICLQQVKSASCSGYNHQIIGHSGLNRAQTDHGLIYEK
jgi:hypothetical protein